MTNQDIKSSQSRLSARHYLLISANPDRLNSFHANPSRGPLADYRERFNDRFALVLWKSADTGHAFFVIPFVRVRAEFTVDRATSKDGGWIARVSKGLFGTSKDKVINVANCHGSNALPQRVLRAAMALPDTLAEHDAAFDELSMAAPAASSMHGQRARGER